jgi:hypothetical protein
MSWTEANLPGFGTAKDQQVRSFFQLGPYLYANEENDIENNGWELWRLRRATR